MQTDRSHSPSFLNGWRGVPLIAATYVYFLIFAQFGFLKRLDGLGIAGAHLKLVMGAMAVGGILSSLLAPRLAQGGRPAMRLRLAFGGCAAAAGFTTLPLTTVTALAIASLIGLSLGLLTVTLVANLDLILGQRQPLLKVGLGTGLGYFLCNVPALFRASPSGIALCSAAICLAGIAFVRVASPDTTLPESTSETPIGGQAGAAPASFGLLLLWFTALIWFDSAAFFIIQNSDALKSGTWEGAAHLWRNGTLHLLAALGSAWLIARRGLTVTLVAAFGCLAAACLLLLHPANAGAAPVLYPIGVSLYSVALVAAPSFLLHTRTREERARKAGLIYAVAGWFGSAMGIGMAQNLHRVPPSFIAGAAFLFLLPLFLRLRMQQRWQAAAVAGSLLLAAGIQHLLTPHARPGQIVPASDAATPVERGRRVYIGEGCIHCHSQYVRPHAEADLQMWGPARDVEEIRREKPPLIGNRRQGPDLTQVGSRRSPLWLRMHFIEPRDVSSQSIMPSYAHLFHDTRGDDLIAYAVSLHTPGSAAHLLRLSATWMPGATATPSPGGPALFEQYCATCHVAGGRARTRWATSFRRLPPDLRTGGLPHLPGPEATSAARTLRLAQIVKFGLPGTDMPGHEYLPDADVEAIAQFVNSLQPAMPGSQTAQLRPR